MKGADPVGNKVFMKKRGRVAYLTFNDPDTLNALTKDLLSELVTHLDKIEKDSDIGVVIMTGTGRAFIAGGDITHMKAMTSAEAIQYSKDTTDIYRRIEEMGKVFIAAVNGYAMGGGCELALACDLRVASTKAKFALPEVKLGIFPGGGGTQRLGRLIGQTKAKEMIFTGDIIDAEEAARINLVNEIVEPEQLEAAVEALAQRVLKNSISAIGFAKDAINRGASLDINVGIDLERQLFGLCFNTSDQKEGMAAFLEKRTPNFI